MGTFGEALKTFEVKATGSSDQVVSGSIREVGERLIDRSPAPEKGNPYSTGKFISNWRYGLESPDYHVSNEIAVRVINDLSDMPAKAGGHIHYLSNGTPYGPYLETGTSRMAAQPMVGLTVLEWPAIVSAQAAKVKA